jgi:DNA-binding PadR family transcriptional regulator
MTIKRNLLDEDFRVILQIFETSNIIKEHITLSKLLDIFDGRISENRISEALDRLFDDGILSAEYKKIGNKWARVYYITGEAESFAEDIYAEVVNN